MHVKNCLRPLEDKILSCLGLFGKGSNSTASQHLASSREPLLSNPGHNICICYLYLSNPRSGPILVVLIYFLLRRHSKIGLSFRFALPAGMLFTKQSENRAWPQVTIEGVLLFKGKDHFSRVPKPRFKLHSGDTIVLKAWLLTLRRVDKCTIITMMTTFTTLNSMYCAYGNSTNVITG